MKVARPVPRHLIRSNYPIGVALLLVICVACAATGTTGAAADRLPVLALQAEPNLAPAMVQAAADAILRGGFALAPGQSHPDLSLRTAGPGERLVYERFYTPVDRFSTLAEGVSLRDLRAAWLGNGSSPNMATLYPDLAGLEDLTALLGNPGPTVKPLPADQVAAAVWANPHGLGILPFDKLTVRVRALSIDGLSLTDNHLDPLRWPLVRRAWLSGDTLRGQDFLTRLPIAPAATNRDPERLTVVLMTGTTALTRGTAAAIEAHHDYAWPARLVGPELARADFTTTSNEVPYVSGCVVNNRAGVMTFCARPEYSATLQLSGIRLVGLTGNHVNDFGTANMLKTLDLYQKQNIRTYGGGRNDQEAQAPLLLQHHGNLLAFVGANLAGPAGAWAGKSTPGSARYVQDTMTNTIGGLKQQGAVVFAELQYYETGANGDYQVAPLPGQREEFQALLRAGADVMTGIQAHAPQSIELRDKGIILYGLGNLYFDQTWSWPTRTGLAARHTIYDGHLINTELLVTVLKDDMQVRWATAQERAQVLRAVFAASGW